MAKTKMFPNVATDEGKSEALKLTRAWKNFKAGLENEIHVRFRNYWRQEEGLSWDFRDYEPLKRLSKRLGEYVDLGLPKRLEDWRLESVADAGAKFLAAWAEANGDDKAVAVRLYWRSLQIEGWGHRSNYAFTREVEARGELKPVTEAAAIEAPKAEEVKAEAAEEPAPEAVEPEPVAAPEVEAALPSLSTKEEVAELVKNRKAFKAALESYAAGVMARPEGLRDYGKKMALLGRYSVANFMLIFGQLAQRGKQPEMVRPFSFWRMNGVCVQKGEKALFIRIPFKTTEWVDDQGRRVAPGTEGAEEQEEIHFGLGHVFDVSQMDPESLEIAGFKRFTYGVDAGTCDAAALWALIQSKDSRVHIGSGQAAGFTDGQNINVSALSSDAAAVHTWAHENGHILCGHTAEEDKTERGLREVEAEAAAVLVCGALGIDALDHGAAYAADWSKAGLTPEQAAKSLTKAEKAARAILDTLTGWGWKVPGMEETPKPEEPKKQPKAEAKAPKAAKRTAAPVAMAAEALPETGLEVKRLVLKLRTQKKTEEAKALLSAALKAKLISQGSYNFQLANL